MKELKINVPKEVVDEILETENKQLKKEVVKLNKKIEKLKMNNSILLSR